MANSVNGQVALTAALREYAGIQVTNAKNVTGQGLLRARVILTTTSVFTVDSPLVDPIAGRTGAQSRIYPLGLSYTCPQDCKVTLFSGGVQLDAYDLKDGSGVLIPLGQMGPPTNAGEVYRVQASDVTEQVELIFHYVIADEIIICAGA